MPGTVFTLTAWRVEIKTPKKAIFPKTKAITATRLKEIVAETEEKTGLNVVLREH